MADHQKNFINTNEVYPILDLINRKRQQEAYRGQFNPGAGGSSSTIILDDKSAWEVEFFSVERDVENPIDPNVIRKINLVYRNGAVDDIYLRRGLNPPVDDSVPDSEYINNLMLTEVYIERTYDGHIIERITAKINRENGYGSFVSVEIDYHDSEFLREHEGGWDE